MTAFLTVAALWLTSPALIFAWIKADEWLDGRWADETPAALPDADAEWLAVLAATEPSMSAHPAAGRIRDLIAANEAARIDEQWEAMNR